MRSARLQPPFRLTRVIAAGALLFGVAACDTASSPPKVSVATPAAPPPAAPATAPSAEAVAVKPAAPARSAANKALAARVKQALVEKKVENAHRIDVVVEDGAVTLFGAVDSPEGRAMAVQVASGIEGVASVQNRLVVAAGS